MSKKNKAKFKKQIRAQVLKEMSKAGQASSVPVTKTTININTATPKEISINNNVAAIPELQNLPQIKADLLKTGIVVAFLAAAIATLAILDTKHHILIGFGNTVFKVLNIQ